MIDDKTDIFQFFSKDYITIVEIIFIVKKVS